MDRMIVVAGVLKRGALFMAYQRPEGKAHAGKWEFPGGKIEQGESPEEALQRELMEELGVQVRVGHVLDVIRKEEQGKEIFLLFYSCETDGEPVPLENGVVRFYPPEDFPALDLAPMDRLFIERGGLARA